jgi:hypothetical protein
MIRFVFKAVVFVAVLGALAVVWGRFAGQVVAERMGKEQTSFAATLAENKFSRAYTTLARWQQHPYLRHSVFPGLVAFWREVGTANTTPTLSLEGTETLPDDVLLKSLRFAVWNDAHISQSFRGPNYFPVFVTVFKNKRSWGAAYVELAVGMGRKSCCVSQAMLKTAYEQFPDPVLGSLDTVTSAATLFAAGRYQDVITLRETVLPDVSQRAPWDTFILGLEVLAYENLGQEAHARELEAKYWEAGVIPASASDSTTTAEQ